MMLHLRDSNTGRHVYLCEHPACPNVQHRSVETARRAYDRLDRRRKAGYERSR